MVWCGRLLLIYRTDQVQRRATHLHTWDIGRQAKCLFSAVRLTPLDLCVFQDPDLACAHECCLFVWTRYYSSHYFKLGYVRHMHALIPFFGCGLLWLICVVLVFCSALHVLHAA